MNSLNENFELVKINKRTIKKYNTEIEDYQVIFKNIPNEFIDSIIYMEILMKSIVERLVEKAKKNDKIKITIDHPVLSEPIEIPFIAVKDLNGDIIINEIAKCVQSNKILTLDNLITFRTLIMHYTTGGGGDVKRLNNFLFHKQSVVRIKNNNYDKLCAIRAIIVGKAIADNDSNYSSIRDSRNTFQTSQSIKIANDLNLPLDQEIGLKEIEVIEAYLKDYQIIIFDGNCMHELMYAGKLKEKKIFLYFRNNHYDTITSLPAFFNKQHYCFECMKPYNNFENHPCNEICKKCKNKLCKKIKSVQCDICKVLCQSEICLQFHLKNVCNKIAKCNFCGKFNTRFHNCNGQWCNYCQSMDDKYHKCYIKTEDEKEKKEIPFEGYIFFDYEAMNINHRHEANLIIANKVCKFCLDDEQCQEKKCQNYIFKNNNDFCEWLFDKNNSHFIAIAHNMKAYDGYFIMNYIINNFTPTDKPPECLLNGSKLLVIKFLNIKIIDSFNFIPMGLSKFPKTFGINELKKGYFPHLFNKPENQNYIGPYPPKCTGVISCL